MLLEVRDLCAGYGKVPVLNQVSFDLDEGETVAIIGPNGAGKTTLLKTICGLLNPTSGAVHFDGRSITQMAPDAIVRESLVYVPEGGRPFPNMSVYDNLLMGAFSNRKALELGILESIHEIFPVLADRRDQLARTLSGGERQMLALARGLVSRPRLIMLDEPSLGLAPKLIDEIYEKIRRFRNEFRLSVLLVEQNTAYALELADRGYVLENGAVVLEGESGALANSEHVKKAYLGL
jgi:branched-chain amino acid transport system ATP-binding protein